MNMKIFVVSPIYPNDENTTLGVFVHEQSKALAELGHEIVVLDAAANRYNKWFKKKFSHISYSIKDGIPIFSYPYNALMTKKFPRIAMYCYSRRLNKIYEHAVRIHGKPDIIYAHFTFTAGYACNYLAKKERVPFVVIEHHSLFLQNKLNKYYRCILKKTVDNADKFIAVSEHLKESIVKITKTEKEIIVIPNMINSIFRYYPVQINRQFKFFSAGNLIESKNFSMLIRAFFEAFSSDDEVELEIAGSGNQEEKLKRLIKKENRSHQIKLLGRLGREEILDKYKECNCFILTSKFETFGLVYREAMAVGRPVISSKNGGIEEKWEEKYGILIERNDMECCKDAMQKMFKGYQNYDSRVISDDIVKNYSEQSIMSKIDEILKSSLNNYNFNNKKVGK